MSYDDLRKGRFSNPGYIYSITTVTQNRSLYFLKIDIGRLVVCEMKRLHDEGEVRSIAWVLMPNHLHWLFQLGEQGDLAQVIKSFKARSARRVNKALGRKGTLWQRAYFDHAIRKEENIREIARYIISNPIRAGLVSNIGNYSLWDAVWL